MDGMTGRSPAPVDNGAEAAGEEKDPRLAEMRSTHVTILLTAVVGVGALSIDMFLPSLPAISGQFESSAAKVQLTVTLFMMAYAGSQLIFGPLSDRYGRRPILLAGLGLYLAGGALCFLAPDIRVLISARILQGVGAGSGPVVGRAIVRDVHPRHQAARVFALMGTAQALTPILAPILGGYLHEWFGWRAVFAVLAGFGLVFLAGCSLTIGETAPSSDRASLTPSRLVSDVGAMLRRPEFLGYILVATLSFGGQFAFISGSAFVLIDLLGVSPEVYGYGFGFVACGILGGNALSARYTTHLGMRKMIFIGACLAAGAGSTMAVLAIVGRVGPVEILGPMVCYALSVGLIMPNAIAGAIGPFSRSAGLASAVIGFLMLSGSAAYSIAVSTVYDGTALPMAAAIALSGIGALASVGLLLRPGT